MGDGIRASPTIREPSVRDFYKAGFLKYLVNLPKDNKVAPTPVRYWTIFSVINEINPVLEFFSEKPLSSSGSSGKPAYIFSLKRCLYLCPVPVIEEKENCFEFIITLDQQSIHLIAPTRQSMEEWIDCIKTKLKQMNILAPQDNYYAKEPVSSVKSRLNQRSNPLSARPLPPIPLSSDGENNQPANQSTGNVPNIRTYSALQLALMTPVPPPRPTTVATQSRNQNSTENSDNQPSYEPIFVSTTTQRLGNMLLDERMTHLPPEEGPPPYEDVDQATLTSGTTDQANTSGSLRYPRNDQSPLSLRESQIFRLKREILHKDGVRVLVRKQDCNESIALVDWLGKVWVAGWKQKSYPQLHNTFHIGDRIMSVCGEPVHDSVHVLRLIKSQPSQIIELIIRRIPHGFVFVLKREYEGQDLGIVREGNTAEVIQVVEGSLAAEKGLRPKAMCVDQSKSYDCNWIITEINNRPLNLFFKGNEIRDRLNAVGKDISILFQPSDLIKVLKKRLKSFKNYKEYIVQ